MLVKTYQHAAAVSGLVLIRHRLSYAQHHVLFGKLCVTRNPMGSLVDVVLKLLTQKLNIFFCSCYGPTESLCTEIELLLSSMFFYTL